MNDQQLSQAFRALSDPNRLHIYRTVLASQDQGVAAPEGGCGIGDLMQKLKIGAPTVSHHVHALQNAGLIQLERQGKFVRCYPNRAAARVLMAFFQLS
ncbi:transcriptional regulator [Bacterioplanes sanyensis]|uniref:Transcriptional regulator n=1 Tax=Bacterioplanes sanyensis TaxID=1249553 RepID=A0A222FPG4_9GAMM|nr:metalloregulator ArsR/SmtB family transcription factor [Bacterioplanes sanyensis]ASP40281.1 transcriptional regulator [Bacterioplanes sanyensis]